MSTASQGEEPFIERFSQELDSVDLSKSSNSRFDRLRELVTDALGLPDDGAYIAGASTRATNLPIRLRQGRAKDRHFPLGIGVLGTQDHDGGIAALHNAMEGRGFDVVALAMRTDAGWRLTDAVDGGGNQGLASQLREHFPDIALHEMPLPEAAPSTPATEVDAGPTRFPTTGDFDDFSSEEEKVDGLLAAFRDFASARGVVMDAAVAADSLGAILASQFLMFAGPSGTGKSTLARLLAAFFAPSESIAMVEARRQWVGQEDLVGYYSAISGTYAATPETFRLLDLANAAVNGERQVPPHLIVEEANLSPIEGHLAPVVHGLGSLSTLAVQWALHSEPDPVVPAGGDAVPGELVLGPYPRVLATVNIDATAPPPARKVAGRAAVIMLEPQPVIDSDTVRELAKALLGSPAETTAPGLGFLGDPLAALRRGDVPALATAFTGAAELLGLTRNSISRRDIARSLVYMAWWVEVTASVEETTTSIGAENALLHYVLPTLSPEDFAVALSSLTEATLSQAGTSDGLGGLLAGRVERLASVTEGSVFGSVDFWTALS